MREYYAVYYDEQDDPARPVGLYRRGGGGDSESYHPRTGWSHTDYWLRIRRGEPDKHLVPVDEARALEVQHYFDEAWRDRLRDEAQGDAGT